MRLVLFVFALTVPLAEATDPQEAPAPLPAKGASPSPASTTLSVEADTRDEYIAGDMLYVNISLQNKGNTPLAAPDLAARPWLVDFELGMPGGTTQHRHTTSPEKSGGKDGGQQISIRPKGERKTLLEVPLSNTLKPGTYTIRITIDLGGGRTEIIAARTIIIATARPVYADLRSQRDPRGPDPVLWVHQAAKGYDLYLHESAEVALPEAGSSAWLLHQELPFQPVLSHTRAGSRGSQHVVWSEGERTIRFARIDGHSLRGAVGHIDTPWPKAERVGEPATDSEGNLVVPLWVPAPKGPGGELRLLCIDERGRPSFRRMGLLPAAPAELQTTVDDSGAVQILVRQTGLLDLYTLSPGQREAARPEALPVPGRRIALVSPGETWLTARFGLLPEAGDQAGGLMVLLMSTSEGQLQTRWLGLRGTVSRTVAPIPWPEGQTLIDLLVGGSESPGLLVRSADGKTTSWIEAGSRSVRLPEGRSALVRANDQRALLRVAANGRPLKVISLVDAP